MLYPSTPARSGWRLKGRRGRVRGSPTSLPPRDTAGTSPPAVPAWGGAGRAWGGPSAWPRPGPARAGAARPHSEPRAPPRRSDPRRSGRRCSGAPPCACACGSAWDSSSASAVSPPPARGRGWPRGGTLSGDERRGRTDVKRGPGAPGEAGRGARGADAGRSTAGRARPPG